MFASLALLAVAHDAFAERQFRKLGEARGLEANVITAMLVDRDGLLWVASREGLFSYDGYLATSYQPDPNRPGSLSDVDIRSVYEASDGAIWVSTNTGGLNRRDPVTGVFTQFHHDSANPRSLSAESVYGVAEDANGNLWVGTQNGLNRLEANGKDFTRFFPPARQQREPCQQLHLSAASSGPRSDCGSARWAVASTVGMKRRAASSISRCRNSPMATPITISFTRCRKPPMDGCGPAPAWACWCSTRFAGR